MPEKLVVHGRITDADGREVSYAQVTVWHQRIRDRDRLGSGDATEEGTYRIECRVPEEGPGNLLLVVHGAHQRVSFALHLHVIGGGERGLGTEDVLVEPAERRDQGPLGCGLVSPG